MFRLCISALLLLLCAACGHFVDEKASLTAYRNAEPRCAAFADLPFEKLAYPADLDMIDEKSPLFDFPGSGRSYFKAFELPSVGGPYRLVVRSYIVTSGFLNQLTFYPLVTFLDADRRPIGTTSDREIRFLGSTMLDEPMENARVQIATLVPPEVPVRYIVVHTSRNLIELGDAGTDPVLVAASAPIFIPMPAPSGGVRTAGSPVGHLKIKLQAPRT
jgi:hypothetical protein